MDCAVTYTHTHTKNTRNYAPTHPRKHAHSRRDAYTRAQLVFKTHITIPRLQVNVKPRGRRHRGQEVVDAVGLVRVELDLAPDGLRLENAEGELPQGPPGVVLVHVSQGVENLTAHGLESVPRGWRNGHGGNDRRRVEAETGRTWSLSRPTFERITLLT